MSSWHPGHEPGRQVVALGVALVLSGALLDLAITGRITWLFDVVFVLTCAALAVLVAPRDLFTVGVLPPLLMLAVFVLVALAHTAALGHRDDSVAQAVVSGLAHHSLALCLGYALCLALLAQRRRLLQPTKRVQSPAPSRSTSG
ncbi:hypothetical protein SAMN04487968_101508 [Nocardioides terrae]|uniref:DUF6542 domain-containing protein n=1 Tax=Nocardioides terrae TaxID=574651 RepID=A0A1I1DW61_9ACTN|nr:DUF6542 domain-containing protein [Nocardioides terrae]SFB78642.1 hypothetical protein SAMN04487968_101508 [Nocardioides terrae]